MKPILEIQNISKKFRIGGERTGYKTLRDSLFSGKDKKEDKGEFWALQDVSFDVFPGDTIGIIGKNGAGKSTLLKILSRITPPTKGKIICRGRIASLLEVGTGFHGELSGRENIYLNGSILGLKKTEINKKFDEIVDFSGVEKFLDTQLKHYSSGMQLRLAFAVAAHLEPEILIIDEVLAVGDAEFQKKCIGKMDEISKEQGRTILFVSHNMSAIKALCQKGIYLKDGMITYMGTMDNTINQYFNNEVKARKEVDFSNQPDLRPKDEIAELISAKLVSVNNNEFKNISIDSEFGIEIEYHVKKSGYRPIPNIHFYKSTGEYVFAASESASNITGDTGYFKSCLWIPANILNDGIYSIGIALSTMSPVKVHFHLPDAIIIDVIEDLSKRHNEYSGSIPGVVRPDFKWETKKYQEL